MQKMPSHSCSLQKMEQLPPPPVARPRLCLAPPSRQESEPEQQQSFITGAPCIDDLSEILANTDLLPREAVSARPQNRSLISMSRTSSLAFANNEQLLPREDSITSSVRNYGLTSVDNLESELAFVGHPKGIQGLKNSSYLDSTFAALFFGTSIFDSAVLKTRESDEDFSQEIKRYLEVQIVGPLRENYFVSGRVVMGFRKKLVSEGHCTPKLLGSFMDAEEFMSLLFGKVLRLPHFITYNAGTTNFIHQIVVPSNRIRGRVASVQDLFIASMEGDGDLKLTSVPKPALLIMMPRKNGELVGFERIIPSLEIDLREVLEDYDENHYSQNVTREFGKTSSFQNRSQKEGSKMKLMAVICFAHSHYTTFVKFNQDWLYFDSMGTEITKIEDAENILSNAENSHRGGESHTACPGRILERIYKDAYCCIYEPTSSRQ